MPIIKQFSKNISLKNILNFLAYLASLYIHFVNKKNAFNIAYNPNGRRSTEYNSTK